MQASPTTTPIVEVSTQAPNQLKFTSLKDLQEQYRKNNVAEKKIVAITPELLELSKQEFSTILNNKKDPSLLVFQQIKIVHKENNAVEMVTDITFNKNFLEDIKDDFRTLLEEKFKQTILLSIQVDEHLQAEYKKNYQTKSPIQIFDDLATQYPLLNIMKEKLNLYVD